MEKKLNMRGQTEIFAGKAQRETTVKFYAESPALFAQIIRENIKPGNYKMADLGGAGGGLCGNLVNLLNDYKLEIDVYDVDNDSLKENNINFKQLQFRRIDGYIDIFIERYELTEEEANLIHKMVADKNYIFQTTWLLDFRNN